MKYRLADLLDIPRLQCALDSLYISSKIPSAIIDIDGNIRTGSGWQDICTKFHRVHPEARKRCIESDLYLNRHIHEANPSIVYQCPHGLVDAATPIVIEGEHLGNVFTGQLFLEEPDLDFFRSQARSYGFDQEKYIDALRKVPIISEQALQENLAFLARLTGMLGTMGLKRKREMLAEQQIRESEERFRNVFRGNGSVMLLIDPESGRIEDANPAAADFYGYPEDVLRTMTIGRINMLSEKDIAAEWAQALHKKRDCFVFPHRVASGEIRTVEVHSSPVQVGGRLLLFSIIHDITERKRAEAEKQKLQDQLNQAMKMEAVGRLAGGVAHDFNNLLTAIIGNVSLTLMKLPPSDPIADMLAEANKAADRAATLTRQLLAFSRKQIIEPKVLNLNELIRDLHSLLVRVIREDIEIQHVPGDDLGSVKVDVGQFQQVLVNLMVNARDAMPNGGRIVIETSNVDLDEEYCSAHPYVEAGRFVMLAVSDTGFGMSEEVRSHIFEPFFTTKTKGSGTGLGLATTYGAVKQSGGSIEVYSEVGKGTTFQIYLPRVEGETSKPVGEDASPALPRGTGTVLLVEDEDVVRDMCVRVLEQLGYQVLQAANGREAIALCEGRRERIDLLLTDVVMPGMNGRELATRLIPDHPEMKVLFASGYAEDVIVRHGVLDDEVSFIGKPYAPSTLAKKIREVLDTEEQPNFRKSF